jgi:hypothetical protein
MPHMMIKNLTLIAHLPDNLTHGQLHHESLIGKNLWLLVLYVGSPRK